MNSDPKSGRDPLAALLRRTDDASPAPPMRSGLADGVRLVARRRRNRRLATGCLGVLIGAGSVAVIQSARSPSRDVRIAEALPPTLPTPPAPTPSVVESGAGYARAEVEADARVDAAYRLLAAERRRRQLDALNVRLAEAAPSQADRIASLRAAAALSLISQADRFKTRADSPLDALATYRRAVELFPDTPWVAVARRRIEQLESQMPRQEIPL